MEPSDFLQIAEPSRGLVGYAEAVVKHRAVLVEFSALCPYLVDRQKRGLRTDVAIGPDEIELWATRIVVKGSGVQCKTHWGTHILSSGFCQRALTLRSMLL